MFNEAIRNEFTKAKRLANLIEEVGNHLAILFEQDNLEMEHFELSEGQTGWIYAIKLKDNDVDFSGVVEYGTCVERLVLNIYEDTWNHEILPESEKEDSILELLKTEIANRVVKRMLKKTPEVNFEEVFQLIALQDDYNKLEEQYEALKSSYAKLQLEQKYKYRNHGIKIFDSKDQMLDENEELRTHNEE